MIGSAKSQALIEDIASKRAKMSMNQIEKKQPNAILYLTRELFANLCETENM